MRGSPVAGGVKLGPRPRARAQPWLRRLGRAALVASLAVAVASSVAPYGAAGAAQEDDAFFERLTDGGWSGTVRFGKRHMPLQVNLNTQKPSGYGFTVVPDDLSTNPETLIVAPSLTFRAIGLRKVIAEFDSAAAFASLDPAVARATSRVGVHKLTLGYKAASDTLRGPLTSTATGVGRGTMLLFRMDAAKHLQKLWSGSVRIAGKPTPLILQLVEGDSVAGRGWLGAETGIIQNGVRAGNRFTGNLKLPSGDVRLTLRLVVRRTRLRGRIAQTGNFNVPTSLNPAGGGGKALAFVRVFPASIPVGEPTVVTLKGRNIFHGATVHTSDTRFAVSDVQRLNPTTLRATVTLAAELPSASTSSLRLVNVDGQVRERANALSTADDGGGAVAIRFSADVQPIFTNRCALAGCHSTARARAGLVLDSGVSYANIVNVRSSQVTSRNRITPGDPVNSYVLMKIRGDSGTTGGRMPLNQSPLDAATIQLIEDWVAQGAANNVR